MLQMQAINALWKKVSTIQPENNETVTFGTNSYVLPNNAEVVKDLAQTCSVLQNQVSFITYFFLIGTFFRFLNILIYLILHIAF